MDIARLHPSLRSMTSTPGPGKSSCDDGATFPTVLPQNGCFDMKSPWNAPSSGLWRNWKDCSTFERDNLSYPAWKLAFQVSRTRGELFLFFLHSGASHTAEIC